MNANLVLGKRISWQNNHDQASLVPVKSIYRKSGVSIIPIDLFTTSMILSPFITNEVWTLASTFHSILVSALISAHIS